MTVLERTICIMKTAKSYENCRQISKPIEKNGKQYVWIEKENGQRKMVRLYSDKEYERMYQTRQSAKTEREALGFNSHGFIYIFKKNPIEYQKELNESNAVYNHLWGWYFYPKEPIPAYLYQFEPIKLYWSAVGDTAGALYPTDRIIKAINSLRYEPGDSVFIGEIGDRLDLYLTLKDTYYLRTPYVKYYFIDSENNLFYWITKLGLHIPKNKIIHLKASVKEHTTEKNQSITVLTRCKLL